MKKFLLLVAGCLLAGGSVLAQEETEAPTVNPGWTITANCLEPSGIEPVVYNMTTSGETKTGATSEIYYANVALPVYPDHTSPKPSKYQYVITYTAEDGTQKTKTEQIIQQISDGDINVTISAWLDASGNMVSYTSVANYILADSNWTGIVYLPASTTGDSNTVYFNARGNNVVSAMRGLNAGSSTDQFLAGNSTQYQNIFISNIKEDQGICSATIDYINSTVVIENVSEITLSISGYTPFVSPADITLPEGVSAYVYDYLEDGVIYLKALDSNVVANNTPVILKADKAGDYTLNITGACQYDPQAVSSRTILLDVNEESSILYGVLQAHFVPADAYTFNGTEFVKTINAQAVINPFTCYLKPADTTTAPDAITVSFPDNDEESSDWNFSFSNENDRLSDNTLTLYTEGTEAVVTVIAPEGIDQLYYAYDLTASQETIALDDTELNYQEASKVEASDENAFSINLPLEGAKTTGTLYIATKDADSDEYTTQGTYSVVITKSVSTGVEGIETTVENGAVYNVFGQKVDKSYKGIVICNGKKYIQR